MTPSDILNRPNIWELKDYNKLGYNPSAEKVWLQLALNVEVSTPPTTEEQADEWMSKLIDRIDMKIAKGPVSWNCEDHGNEGISSMVMITTSTCTMHFWGNHLMLDVFSCKHFEVSDVLGFIRETFGLNKIRLLQLLDRSCPPFPQIPVHIVYKTTNNLNNKIYIGVHSSYLFQDDYLGSGKLLKKAIEKHGRQNFTFEVIKVFTNSDDAYSFENSIVTKEFTERHDTYNIAIGGRRPVKSNDCLMGQSLINKQRRWVKNSYGECRFTLDHSILVDGGDWEYGRVLQISDAGMTRKIRAAKSRIITDEERRSISNRMKGRPSKLKGKKFSVEEKSKRYKTKSLFCFQSPTGEFLEIPSSHLTQISQDVGQPKWFLHDLAYKNREISIKGWICLGKKEL